MKILVENDSGGLVWSRTIELAHLSVDVDPEDQRLAVSIEGITDGGNKVLFQVDGMTRDGADLICRTAQGA